jgi:hypothetical protein
MRLAAVTVSALLCVVVPRAAFADNTSFANAQNIFAGQAPAQYTLASGNRYYVFNAVIGRSYCAEISAPTETAAVADAGVVAWRANTTTSLISNDDTTQEPFSGRNSGGFGLSRGCWIAPDTEANFIQTYAFVGTAFQLRVVETTLFSNWFFLGTDYAAYTLLRNSTSTTVAYTLTWRNGSGTAVATASGTLAANGSGFVNARDHAGAVAAVSGTVEIAHTSSPGAIVASTTVLSATTGLSFDAPFAKRDSW